MADPDRLRIARVRLAGDAADERKLRLAERQLADQRAHVRGDALHQGRVECVRDVERRRLDRALLERLARCLDARPGPGHDGLLRVVDVRDDDARNARDHLRDELAPGGGARHRARVGEVQIDHREASARDQPHALLGRDHSGSRSGCELSEAVAERDVRAHAEVREHAVQREAQRSHRRLADLRRCQARFRLGRRRRVEERAQRSAQLRVEAFAQRVVERVEPRAERRDLLVRLAQEADLLRALSGEEQRDLRSGKRPLREDCAGQELRGGARGVGRCCAAVGGT